MITLIKLHNVIVDKIRNCIIGSEFEGIEIISSDVSEGFARPSIKVDFDNMELGNLNSNFLDRSLTVRVYFFATNLKKYKIENIQMQELLEFEFINGIKTEYGFVWVNDVSSEIVDTVLQFEFDIEVNALKVDHEDLAAEYMEDLQFEIKNI